MKGIKKLKKDNSYTASIGDIHIDGKKKGNQTRFINHSCSPNCKLVKRKLNGHEACFIIATKDINQNDFISFQYGYQGYQCWNNCCKESAKKLRNDEFDDPHLHLIRQYPHGKMNQIASTGSCGYLALIKILQHENKVRSTTVKNIRNELHEHAKNNKNKSVGTHPGDAVYKYSQYSTNKPSGNSKKYDQIIEPIYKEGKKYTSWKGQQFMDLDVIPIAMHKYTLRYNNIPVTEITREEIVPIHTQPSKSSTTMTTQH